MRASLILIVEDEVDLVDNLEYNLQKEGYQTRSAYDGESAIAALRDDPLPDLVILDLMLPDMAGTEICRFIRNDESTRSLPVLMLTARGEETDRVVGFEAGADDYVVKPFSVRELMLRVRALLRRNAGRASSPEEISFGLLQLNIPACTVHVAGENVQLTALEFRLLKTLFVRRGRAQSREVLLADVWEITADVMTRTVDTHIKRLREKLGPAGAYIETLRGIGYRFTETPPKSLE